MFLIAAAICGGQVEAAKANHNAEHYDGNANPTTEGPYRAPVIIQVEPSTKEVEAEAERQAVERRIFGLEPDAWVALFTFALTCFTTLLWLETRRLAEGDRERFFAAHGPRISMALVSLYWSDDQTECGVKISLTNLGGSKALIEEIRTAPRIGSPGNFEFPRLIPRPFPPFHIEAGSSQGVTLIDDHIIRDNVVSKVFVKPAGII